MLILDEATSALDSETEKAFIDALTSLRGKITMIVIAHRQSSIDCCDREKDYETAWKFFEEKYGGTK